MLGCGRPPVPTDPPCPSELLDPVVEMVSGAVGVEVQGMVSVTVEPVGPQCLQNVTVVVQVTVDGVAGVSVGDAGTVVGIGRVRVTVVGVGAQCVQTVTVVVQPSGTDAVVVAKPDVVVAVASGQTVIV